MKEISDSSILNFDFNRNFCSTLKSYVERASTTRGGFGMGFFGDPQSPWKGLFEIWGFLSPRIEDLFLSGNFYPRNWGFLKSWNFYSRELGSFISRICEIPGNFWGWGFFEEGFFFVRWDIPPKSHFCSTTNTFVNLPRIFNYLNLSSLNPR